jgi:hypothetical protein
VNCGTRRLKTRPAQSLIEILVLIEAGALRSRAERYVTATRGPLLIILLSAAEFFAE